ncbi:DUF3021 domain-containing protein [Oceanobacillus sp. FSL K6-2867]|uniref:DUF3021 domain-containing protein n=1 Tax=Oceanobacillus sp. FSL K6-2867 TaxID=2954748 RepID=UPI0030D94631
MIIEILKRTMIGLGFACIFTFIALTIIVVNNHSTSVSEVWMHMLASMTIGVYFGLSSFIYMGNEWSYIKRTIVHFSVSVIFYFSIAFSVGWVPFGFWPVIGSLLAFIAIYAIFGTGYYLYYKRLETSLNEELKKRNENAREH